MWFMSKKTLSDEQATALHEQAWAAFREQDLDTAQECFQILAKACPADARWMNGVGAVSLARDDRADAHRHFQMAADRDYPGSHYNLGIMAYQDGDHDVARRPPTLPEGCRAQLSGQPLQPRQHGLPGR